MNAVREEYGTGVLLDLAAVDEAAYCPECGRAWQTTPSAGARPGASITWWAWLLVAIGMYLVVVFVPRVWSSVPGPGTTQVLLPSVTCLIAGTEQDFADCDPTKPRAVTAFGLAWIVVGLGAIARRTHRLPWRRTLPSHARASGPARHTLLAGILRGGWAFAETMGRSSFVLLLVMFGYVGASRLIEGVPPSGALIAQSIDRAIGAIVASLHGL